MRRRTRRHVSPIDRADAVLAGRRQPTVVELLELIHEVNPTRRALPAREERHRYKVKNQLQAMLIRRFPDELRIEPAPPGSPDVGLRHRYSGLDACHVRVGELDPDARSWVLRQIDLGETAPELPPAPVDEPQDDPESVPGLLRSAREAIASYDYPVAEERLRLALQRSAGGVAVAAALLELLVDTLARDSDALALVPALSREAKAQPSVRALLALAAARAGDELAASDWLGGADGAQCADAWAQLAALALVRDDLAATQDALDRLRELDPVHPRLVEVSEALEARRREMERPLAEQRRREKEAQEAQRRAQVEALVAQAREYERAGDDEAALRAWEDADALGGECAQQAAATRERLRERTQRAQVERVVAGLADPGADALEAYGLLPDAAREQVRARVSLPHLGWMEEMYASESGAKARAGAEAALAFAEARLRLEAGRFDEVLSMLAPHMRLLSHVPEAKRMQAQAREGANQEAERRRVLEAEVRAREEAAERDWQRAVDRDRLRAESDSHAAAGRWLEAVRSAELALRIEQDDERREGLRERVRRAARAQRDAWGFRQWDGPLPTSLLREMGLGAGNRLRDLGAPVLAPDGQALVLAAVHGHTLMVAEVALDASHVRRVSRLRLPSMLALSMVVARTASLLFADLWGRVFELGWPDFGVRRWENLRELPGMESAEVVQLAQVPDSSCVWVSGHLEPGKGTWLVDLTTRQVLRRDQKGSFLAPVRDGDEWLTAVLEADGMRLHWRRGGEMVDERGVPGQKMLAVRSGPAATGPVVLSAHLREGADPRLVLSAPRRAEAGEWPLDGTEVLDRPHLATAPDEGLVAVLLSSAADRQRRSLWLLEWRDERPVLLGTRTVGADARFIHGAPGAGALLLDSLGEAPRTWAMQRALPDWPERPAEPPRLLRALRSLSGSFPCMPHLVEEPFMKRELDVKLASVANPRGLMSITSRPLGGRLAALYYDALLRLHRFDQAHELLFWAEEQEPGDANLALRFAELLMRDGQWEKARTCLEALSVDALVEPHRRHAIHLRALAHMHLGDLAKAREVLDSASEEAGGTCALDAVGEMLDVLEDPARADAAGTRTMAADWWRSTRAFDEALLGRGSIQALLDERAAWDFDEVQVLARRAEGAWRTASSPQDELRLEIAAWRFIAMHRAEPQDRWELPFGAAWSKEALDELAERLSEWLSLPSATG